MKKISFTNPNSTIPSHTQANLHHLTNYFIVYGLDITQNKTKKGGLNNACKPQCTLLSMNCTPNLIAITIPEETRHS